MYLIGVLLVILVINSTMIINKLNDIIDIFLDDEE